MANQTTPVVHVMLDIETMGTRPGAMIASIGACTFAHPGQGRRIFRHRILLEGQDRLGLHMDPATVGWWLDQSAEARAALSQRNGASLLAVALTGFSGWLAEVRDPLWLGQPARLRIWGNGATFDVVLMEAAYRAADLLVPWGFRDARDLRTLLDLAGVDGKAFPAATLHDALSDALAQAAAAEAALDVLGQLRAAAERPVLERSVV